MFIFGVFNNSDKHSPGQPDLGDAAQSRAGRLDLRRFCPALALLWPCNYSETWQNNPCEKDCYDKVLFGFNSSVKHRIVLKSEELVI